MQLRLACALGLIALGCGCGAGDDAADPALTREMESVESTTESFANALLDLSVATRRRDAAAMARFVAPRIISNGMPSDTGVAKAYPWVATRTFAVDAVVSEREGNAFVAEFGTFLERYRELEDVRIKVAQSTVEADGSIVAKLKFWMVGRDRDGQRLWTRGKAGGAGRSDGEQWQLTRFELTELSTMVAARDLFDEVAEPAGLLAAAPLLAQRRDESFAAYGAATTDVDGDGFLDLFVTGAGANHLYLGAADGRFRDVAGEALLRQLPRTATGPLFLDYDGDGDADLFLAAIGDQFLLENRRIPDGKLEFWDVSQKTGVARHAIGFSAIAGDINDDGIPDVYVTSYNRYGDVMPDSWDGATNGTPNLLFVSNGKGGYREAAAAMGVDDRRWSYAAGFADIDGDGRLDLYVANDYGGGNALYMRRGERFVDEAKQRGVRDGGYGMGVSFGDYDNDGHLDLHVTRMSSTAGRRILARLGGGKLPQRDRLEEMAVGNALYRGSAGGTFAEVSTQVGPFGGGWAWGGGFIDFDNDGREDLYTPNGFISGPSLKDT